MFKKTESISASDSKIIKPVIEKRAAVRKGVAMVQDFLKRSNSKLTVYICSFIMRKVKSKIHEL